MSISNAPRASKRCDPQGPCVLAGASAPLPDSCESGCDPAQGACMHTCRANVKNHYRRLENVETLTKPRRMPDLFILCRACLFVLEPVINCFAQCCAFWVCPSFKFPAGFPLKPSQEVYPQKKKEPPIWLWLKIKQEGQNAGFGPCVHLTIGVHFGTGFLSPGHLGTSTRIGAHRSALAEARRSLQLRSPGLGHSGRGVGFFHLPSWNYGGWGGRGGGGSPHQPLSSPKALFAPPPPKKKKQWQKGGARGVAC